MIGLARGVGEEAQDGRQQGGLQVPCRQLGHLSLDARPALHDEQHHHGSLGASHFIQPFNININIYIVYLYVIMICAIVIIILIIKVIR